MSASTMDDAWAPVTAHYRDQVYKATWGHLAPIRNKIYRGHIVFALGMFGSDHLNPTVLACEMGVDESPWFFDAMIEFLASIQGDAGGLYRWEGVFRNYKFKGAVTRLQWAPAQSEPE